MTEETNTRTSGKDEPDAGDAADPRSQDEIRDRVIKLAFGGDPARYEEFLKVLSDATPDGVQVILRGSAITGHKHGSDDPFDADGPGTSDLDVTFVGGNMVMLYNEFHIHSIHSVPLSDEHPYASAALGPLRDKLCEMTGRPVNIQATTSLVQSVRDIVMDQPYLVLLHKPEADEAADL
ncbi:MAG TPA: hypothetical protein VM053_06575 [Gemmatimonadaceae bacterium]|nr:hypothetical protein [Gemmatimonadaceae bacterium]